MNDRMKPSRWAKLAQAVSPGYGTCLRCGWPWNLVENHGTEYMEGSGCFPLCEDCWTELGDPDARLPYYRELWELWKAESPEDDNGQPWEETWTLMETAVREGR